VEEKLLLSPDSGGGLDIVAAFLSSARQTVDATPRK
jgi:hypothetical protein